MGKPSIQTIEEYISQFPDEMQLKLNRLRKIINQTAPSADERLAWGVPTYYQRGFLVEFAAFKNHIGFYWSPTRQIRKTPSRFIWTSLCRRS